MVKQPKTEEELKAEIFKVYSEIREDPSSDRRQVYFGQLCDWIFKWCKGYLYRKNVGEWSTGEPIKETDEMGVEIVEAVDRITREDKLAKLENKNVFFKYLKVALNNAHNERFRKSVSGSLRIPRIIKKVEQFLRMEESDAGRVLTENERVQRISMYFYVTEKRASEYLKAIDTRFDVGLILDHNDDEEADILNLKEAISLYTSGDSGDPQYEYLFRLNTQIILEAVESVLEKAQQRTREIYKELFTLHCLNEVKNYEGLLPVFASEIVEGWKEGKKPTQKEIYLKHHPDAADDSAESRGSAMSKAFLRDLYAVIKEKHPEIQLPKLPNAK
jgi:hypothetical protein